MSSRLQARAKVNLTLEVLGKRPDGYHEIASVMQALDLHDTVEIRPADELLLTCNWPELAVSENLVLKAARLLQKASGVRKGAHVNLTKRIPLAAGLGGGSSDAAAALQGLNQLWGEPLSFRELSSLAAAVGSDVAFFLVDGTALAEGRGEKVTPLPPFPRHWVVLLVPEVSLISKTGYLYSLLSPESYTRGEATRAVVDSLKRGESPDHSLFVNVFQDIALRQFSEVRSWHDKMRQLGAERVWLAGSGPTLFTLLTDEEPARRLAQRLEALGGRVHVTFTV